MVASEVVAGLRSTPCGRRLLAAAGECAGVWLVGGAVRDMLLGNAPRELDVAVEGEIEPLVGALGGTAQRHARFGTATVIGEDGCRYDLARTRTETYPEPGALPEVEPAPLRADLARRDVTVNAIAVALPSGHVECVAHAWEDLQQRMLRVLHERSFVDDPTRLWRVARYAARLGFTVEPHTAELARVAGPGAVSGERLGHEVRLALAEDDPFAVFEQVAALNPMALPEGFLPRPGAAAAALALLPADGRRDLTALAACCAGIDAELLQRWLGHLEFPAADRDVVTAASRWVTGAPLRSARTPVEIARAAEGAPIEAVALAGGANARVWIDELRHVRLEISGDDLLDAGIPEGPDLGRRLRAVLERRRAGELQGREQQLRAAIDDEPGASSADEGA
jgi:tRNA nucleotidyltransferase (CCA-adding enzyme)